MFPQHIVDQVRNGEMHWVAKKSLWFYGRDYGLKGYQALYLTETTYPTFHHFKRHYIDLPRKTALEVALLLKKKINAWGEGDTPDHGVLVEYAVARAIVQRVRVPVRDVVSMNAVCIKDTGNPLFHVVPTKDLGKLFKAARPTVVEAPPPPPVKPVVEPVVEPQAPFGGAAPTRKERKTHTTMLTKDRLVRGIESTWAATEAARVVLKENKRNVIVV